MNLPSWLGEGARHYLRRHSSYFALVCAGVYFQPLVSVRLRGYRNWVGVELVMHELLVLPIRPAVVATATPINSPIVNFWKGSDGRNHGVGMVSHRCAWDARQIKTSHSKLYRHCNFN